MGKIQVQIRTPFGEIVIEGSTAQEILTTLRTITPEIMREIDDQISLKFTPVTKTKVEGIVELTTEGPIITTREKLTHYEAIGLILFAIEKKASTSSKISQLLSLSGIKSMVPARLNEMTKRGIVFKPDPVRAEFKLTAKGEKWIEEKVLPRIQGITG